MERRELTNTRFYLILLLLGKETDAIFLTSHIV